MANQNSLNPNSLKSLIKLYITALGIIAILVIISQFFIQKALSKSDFDAQIINIAGKQRMLSQKISKALLLIDSPIKVNRDNIKEINTSILEWSKAHTLLKNNLKNLSSPKEKKMLTKLFFEVDLEINELITITKNIQENINSNNVNAKKWITAFVLKEPSFLKKMNDYVYAYESYTNKKIDRIKKIEYLVFFLVLFLLIVELLFLFKPAAKKINKTILELLESNDNALKMADRANTAVKQKNEHLQELQLLQKAINQTLIFARIDKNGQIISTGNRLKNILKKNNTIQKNNIYENLGLKESDLFELKNLIDAQKGTLLNHEYQVALKDHNINWLDISVFPIIKQQGVIEYLMVCVDITNRKIAQQKNEVLQHEKQKNETALQKSKASLIVEAQEEERKRIAKDIHDSIGQMLTALKFNLESLNVNQTENLGEKINLLKKQTKDIILGVRMATFNLTPPELLDYGVITALQKMVTQLNKFSNAEIIYQNTVEENIRFNTLVETNLYRVTQECINNSIKYSEANYILVSVKKTQELLSVSVTDNGKGFDIEKVSKKPKGGSDGGMGLFFMKERMEYINGRVFINSNNQGTRVVINYPIKP